MKTTIEIDIDDVYGNLKFSEQQTFMEDNIRDATDDTIVGEVVSRDLLNDVLERYNDDEIYRALQDRLDNINEYNN